MIHLRSFLKISCLTGLVISGLDSVSSAQADNWACEIALCLSNPAGPMAVSQCVPPIKKLYKHLAKGKSFPLCQSANDSVRFTRYGKDHYEDCPTGAKTIYHSGSDRGSRDRKFCELFTPIHGSVRGSIGRSRDDRDSNRYNDRPYYDVRTINGQKIYGKVEFHEPPRRLRPNYLEYVVQGNTNRIWW